jgi:aspartate-semialdehyde dehydrogenase
MKKLNVGVVGATGVVGETFISLLKERQFPVGDLKLFASESSKGLTRHLNGKDYPITTLEPLCFKGLDVVFFSAGEGISKEWAPIAVECGAFAIDNSSAFRMMEQHDLVVPEVNGDLLDSYQQKPRIVANPNCSSIQLVVALKPLQKDFGIESVKVASYQSVSGAGREGMTELIDSTQHELNRLKDKPSAFQAKIFPKNIGFNSIPQIGEFDESGFCGEENKIMMETKKMLRQNDLKISAFTVRVPTLNSHAEAVWVSLKKNNLNLSQVTESLKLGEGLKVIALKDQENYPTQSFTSGKDGVYVGRIHAEHGSDNTWMMWVVSDNLRKGAALNGIQIAERIFDITKR